MGRHAFSLQTSVDLATLMCWERDGTTSPRPKPQAILSFLDSGIWGGREIKIRVKERHKALAAVLDAVESDAAIILDAARRHPVWKTKTQVNATQFFDLVAHSALPTAPEYLAFGVTQRSARLHGAIATRQQSTDTLDTLVVALLDDPARFYETACPRRESTPAPSLIKELKLNPSTLLDRYYAERDVLTYPGAPPLASISLFRNDLGLEESQVHVEMLDPDWRLSADLEHRVAPVLSKARAGNKRIYNNKNARLEGWKHDPVAGLYLAVRPTWYFYHLATNVSVDSQIGAEKEPLRDRVIQRGSLEPLPNSMLSNELGLNALLVTADDFLVLPQRSDAVVGTENLVGPSVSGAVAWYHRDEHGVCPFQALRTQLADELGLFEPDIPDARLVGLSRGLVWGGHPSVRFIVKTPLTYPDVMSRFAQGTRDNWEARGPRSFTMLRASDITGLESVIRNPNAAPSLRAMLIHYIAHVRATARS